MLETHVPIFVGRYANSGRLTLYNSCPVIDVSILPADENRYVSSVTLCYNKTHYPTNSGQKKPVPTHVSSVPTHLRSFQ